MSKKIKIKGEEFDVSEEKYIEYEITRELTKAVGRLAARLH